MNTDAIAYPWRACIERQPGRSAKADAGLFTPLGITQPAITQPAPYCRVASKALT